MALAKQAKTHEVYLSQLLKTKHTTERKLLLQSSTVNQLLFLFATIKKTLLKKIELLDSVIDKRKLDKYQGELTRFIQSSTAIRKLKK